MTKRARYVAPRSSEPAKISTVNRPVADVRDDVDLVSVEVEPSLESVLRRLSAE
jgi:hypothetical protein